MWLQLSINGGARSKTQLANGEGILGISEGWEYRLENMGGAGSKLNPTSSRGILGIGIVAGTGLNMRGCSKQPH